ncbi:MAG TPA: hypothetical protein VLA37_09305 [Sphingomonadaceae bacterium]|nr:hypothetical protein [Sphingomonadaceae bacterium]
MAGKFLTATAMGLLLSSCGQDSSAGQDNRGETYLQAHDIKQLMATVVQPQSEVFWGAAGSISDETGTHDLRPTTDERWNQVVSSAATVTEMGNLLMTPLYAEGRGDDWITFSRGLVQIGQRAEQAARDRASEDELFTLGGDLYNVCQACHQAYPQEGEGAQADLEDPTAG